MLQIGAAPFYRKICIPPFGSHRPKKDEKKKNVILRKSLRMQK